MSNNEERQKIVIFDNDTWVAKTLEHEITNKNPNADVKQSIKVTGKNLKDYLDKVPKPDKLDRDKVTTEVLNKTTVWLPFTIDEWQQGENPIYDEYCKLRDDYPHLSISASYGQMSRSWLHELARKYGVVPITDVLNDQGESVPGPQAKAPEPVPESLVGDLGTEEGKGKNKSKPK